MSTQFFSIIPNIWVDLVKYLLIFTSVLLLFQYIFRWAQDDKIGFGLSEKAVSIHKYNYYWISLNTAILVVMICLYFDRINKETAIKNMVGLPGIQGPRGKRGKQGPTGI